MMKTQKIISWIFSLAFILNAINMNAQNKTNESQTLDTRQQSLITISALTASGHLEALKTQLSAGLDAGLTINEIKEALVQLYAYCGFPRSLNALNTFKSVLDERKAKGIKDVVGKPNIVENKVSDKYEQGRKVIEQLTGVPQSKPAPGFGEFSPRIDAFLKEHLFADIFVSDVLTHQQRELVTIAALASMTGVEPQLQAHIGMGKNTGITEAQLEQVADLIDKHINRTQANIMRKLISKPLLPVTEPDMMVRISEIEIMPEYLEEYKAILKEEAAASVIKEQGVISIFAMFQKEHPTQVRIVEIYASREAYQAHIASPHFQHYKTTTLKMVKDLKLVDMNGLDPETMTLIFEKMKK